MARRPLPGFTVDTLWREMGMADDAELGTRKQTQVDAAASVKAEDPVPLIHEIGRLADELGRDKQDIANTWLKHYGHQLAQTTDISALTKLRDRLRSEANA